MSAEAPKKRVDLPTRDGYDRWAALYDQEDNPLVILEEPLVASRLGDVAGRTIADIGCGTGRHALRLAATGATVTAIDFSPGMLARAGEKLGAQQRERVSFVEHDVTKRLPLSSETFDHVLSCLMLEHVLDLGAFFAELARIARPGGQVLVTAMHPALMLRGVTARFTDPQTDEEVRPLSHPHQLGDFVMAAIRAGLSPTHLGEHTVDAALAERAPRAARYLGWPLLFVMDLVRVG